MSFRTTALLVFLFAALGGYVYYYGPKDEVKRAERPPFVYEIDLSDIVHLDVRYQGKLISMDWDDAKNEWNFLPESGVQGKIDQLRVNGIRLLLTGPGSTRELVAEKVTNLTNFGLQDPPIVANVRTKNGKAFRVLIGDRSPNGQANYVKLADFDPVFLVDYTWSDELSRFVVEPPLAKEEPTS
ncbi:MAG: DUF4340 domain-containing protein [Chloroflexi bacterium]|nr:DUF4340 domain-containing protein [Chloroflexota bacterium]